MALPILDGNQSATTLSTILTGGAHIPAHTVVSLGSQAISDITSAVSGVSLSISGTQTVTGSVSILNFPASQAVTFGTTTGFVSIVGTPSVTFTAVTIPQINKVVDSVATDGVLDTTINFIKIGGHQSGSNQTAHIVHVSNGGAMSVDATDSVVSISNFPATQAVSGTVTVGNFPSTQTIAGTVTANLPLGNSYVYLVNGDNDGIVGSSNPIPVTGSVSVGNISADGGQTFEGFLSVKVDQDYYQTGLDRITPEVTVTNLVNVGDLTTRFGSPTTANVAFATSAVTNYARKYLLIQNVTTGSNVITVGIGFTPTTTRGIQLTAGAGITFESSYIPAGQVFVLSSVTASNFTILEG